MGDVLAVTVERKNGWLEGFKISDPDHAALLFPASAVRAVKVSPKAGAQGSGFGAARPQNQQANEAAPEPEPDEAQPEPGEGDIVEAVFESEEFCVSAEPQYLGIEWVVSDGSGEMFIDKIRPRTEAALNRASLTPGLQLTHVAELDIVKLAEGITHNKEFLGSEIMRMLRQAPWPLVLTFVQRAKPTGKYHAFAEPTLPEPEPEPEPELAPEPAPAPAPAPAPEPEPEPEPQPKLNLEVDEQDDESFRSSPVASTRASKRSKPAKTVDVVFTSAESLGFILSTDDPLDQMLLRVSGFGRIDGIIGSEQFTGNVIGVSEVKDVIRVMGRTDSGDDKVVTELGLGESSSIGIDKLKQWYALQPDRKEYEGTEAEKKQRKKALKAKEKRDWAATKDQLKAAMAEDADAEEAPIEAKAKEEETKCEAEAKVKAEKAQAARDSEAAERQTQLEALQKVESEASGTASAKRGAADEMKAAYAAVLERIKPLQVNDVPASLTTEEEAAAKAASDGAVQASKDASANADEQRKTREVFEKETTRLIRQAEKDTAAFEKETRAAKSRREKTRAAEKARREKDRQRAYKESKKEEREKAETRLKQEHEDVLTAEKQLSEAIVSGDEDAIVAARQALAKEHTEEAAALAAVEDSADSPTPSPHVSPKATTSSPSVCPVAEVNAQVAQLFDNTQIEKDNLRAAEAAVAPVSEEEAAAKAASDGAVQASKDASANADEQRKTREVFEKETTRLIRQAEKDTAAFEKETRAAKSRREKTRAAEKARREKDRQRAYKESKKEEREKAETRLKQEHEDVLTAEKQLSEAIVSGDEDAIVAARQALAKEKKEEAAWAAVLSDASKDSVDSPRFLAPVTGPVAPVRIESVGPDSKEGRLRPGRHVLSVAGEDMSGKSLVDVMRAIVEAERPLSIVFDETAAKRKKIPLMACCAGRPTRTEKRGSPRPASPKSGDDAGPGMDDVLKMIPGAPGAVPVSAPTEATVTVSEEGVPPEPLAVEDAQVLTHNATEAVHSDAVTVIAARWRGKLTRAALLERDPQQLVRDLISAIEHEDEQTFSEVMGRVRRLRGYGTLRCHLVAVPPLHRLVSKGQTHMVEMLLDTVRSPTGTKWTGGDTCLDLQYLSVREFQLYCTTLRLV